MRQEINTYLINIKDTLYDLSNYLYNNPEESFQEYNACKYITDILRNHNFDVKENFLQMPTAFYAQFGSGHPKVCYLCHYDGKRDLGHITGNNLTAMMSLGAALALKEVSKKLEGTVIIIGCPGELTGGSKATMAKEGVFEDIDVVLMASPNTITAESGTSPAVLPLKVKYKGKANEAYIKTSGYSSLDCTLFTLTALNLLLKGFGDSVRIATEVNSGGNGLKLPLGEAEINIQIQASSKMEASKIEEKIIATAVAASSLMNISFNTSLYDLPYDELITNPTLSRIFCHNLKECGIIDGTTAEREASPLSIGSVSHHVPCIYPYISITDDSSIHLSTPAFAKAATTDFALDTAMKATQALALTGLDMMENRTLISDVRSEFFKYKS
jgi:metal-dependent amidase/aminoacylase/carboxypeptidase family protein